MKIGYLSMVGSALLALTATATASTNATRTATFSVSTEKTSDKYAPRHVLAIWVTDSEGTLIRTLKADAKKRKKHLVQWVAASGDTTQDAVTGATRTSHQPVTVVWDCKDTKGKPVPDGTYRIRVEFTEANGPGPCTPAKHIEFTVGPKAMTVKPKDLPHFKSMSLTFTPAQTQEKSAAGQ